MGVNGYRISANTNCYSSYSIEIDEFKFFKIISNVIESYTEDQKSLEEAENGLDWLMSMDLYDILDSSVMESIGFREFCALVLVVASVESGQLLKCLYDHGPLLFDIIGGGQQMITGE